MNTAQIGAKLAIFGTLEFRDKDGNILKAVGINGSVPLTPEQAEDVKKELENSNDDLR